MKSRVGISDSEVQTKLGREINPVLYSEESFRERLKTGFLKGVVESPKLFLTGGEDQLEEAGRHQAPERR